ncbi:MAG: DUF2905 domain-containing protein [Bacteroidia bacterium]
MNSAFGKYIIIAGLIIAVIGAIIYFAGNKLSWFGNLPGDIKLERNGFKLYFPIVTMLLLSLILNLIIYLVRKFL